MGHATHHSSLAVVFRERAAESVEVSLQPERRLLVAMLQDAIRTVLKRRTLPRRQVVETEDWFAANDVDWPFSFCNVCEALGLDPRALRAWLTSHAADTSRRVVLLPHRQHGRRGGGR